MHPKLDENKVAFVTVPCTFRAYTGTRLNAATQIYPIQAYQWLSAWLKQLNFKTCVLDMAVADPSEAWKALPKFLLQEKPKYIGLMVVTPSFYEVKLVGMIAKDLLGPDVVVIHGGIHASALPEESLTETMCDAVVTGEGEKTFGEICQGMPLKDVKGIVYREDKGRRMTLTAAQIVDRLTKDEPAYNIQLGAVISDEPDIRRTVPRPLMRTKELDSLPFQDLELYDVWRYKNPRIIAKSHPLINFETSRGCPFTCNFCSAEDSYRTLSPDRVIEHLQNFKRHGIREVRFSDDQFLTNIKRGKAIVSKMLETNLKFDINLGNGVRADRCDEEFLQLFKRAGLYQLGAGFESGDQASLDSLQKSLDVEKSVSVMQMIRRQGIEVVGFFMIGTPADTFRSMQKTIDFAKLLMPDFAKVTICIPFPDTRLFADYNRRGLILSRKWDDYNIHKSTAIYRHPNPELTPEVLSQWYNKFYREFYGNPRYLARQGVKSVLNGSVFWKGYYAVKTFFPKFIPGNPMDHMKPTYIK